MKIILMAGGFGTRLWPLSRKFLPKQFAKLFLNDLTLFQKSLIRLSKNFNCEILIIINKIHLNLALNQITEMKLQNYKIILEEKSQNTFPAILSACAFCNENETIFVASSDHLIENELDFQSNVLCAYNFAKKNKCFVIFGIKPNIPSTGYGYILKDKLIDDRIYKVKKFKEKPSLNLAKKYIADGNYFWNSGMFLINVEKFLDEIKKFEKQSYLAYLSLRENLLQVKQYNKTIRSIPVEIFLKMKKDSIDYVLLEKSNFIYVIEGKFSWNDLGNWNEVANYEIKDVDGNFIKNTISLNNKDCYILNNSLLNIATIGLKDLIIVAENDSMLIMNKKNNQDIKKIVANLTELDSTLYPCYETRPWGNFKVIFQNKNTKIKQLEINSNQRLSLQSHKYRSEHWVVTSGKATVTLNQEIIEVKKNESIFIPSNAKHRIENKEKETLIVIEVQIGSYLGEDDIARYQDDYKRN